MSPLEHMVRGFLAAHAGWANTPCCIRRVIASAAVGDPEAWQDVASDIEPSSPLGALAARKVGQGDVHGAAECFALREHTPVEEILAVYARHGRWPAPAAGR